MGVSLFVGPHRATRPTAGMQRVRWAFAQLCLRLHNISFSMKSAASPHIEPALSPFNFFGNGCVAWHGKPSFKGEELR